MLSYRNDFVSVSEEEPDAAGTSGFTSTRPEDRGAIFSGRMSHPLGVVMNDGIMVMVERDAIIPTRRSLRFMTSDVRRPLGVCAGDSPRACENLLLGELWLRELPRGTDVVTVTVTMHVDGYGHCAVGIECEVPSSESASSRSADDDDDDDDDAMTSGVDSSAEATSGNDDDDEYGRHSSSSRTGLDRHDPGRRSSFFQDYHLRRALAEMVMSRPRHLAM